VERRTGAGDRRVDDGACREDPPPLAAVPQPLGTRPLPQEAAGGRRLDKLLGDTQRTGDAAATYLRGAVETRVVVHLDGLEASDIRSIPPLWMVALPATGLSGRVVQADEGLVVLTTTGAGLTVRMTHGTGLPTRVCLVRRGIEQLPADAAADAEPAADEGLLGAVVAPLDVMQRVTAATVPSTVSFRGSCLLVRSCCSLFWGCSKHTDEE